MSTEAVSIKVIQQKKNFDYGTIMSVKSYRESDKSDAFVLLAVNDKQISVLEGTSPNESKASLTITRTIDNPVSVCKYNKDYFIIDSKKKLLYRLIEGGKRPVCELSLVTRGSDMALSLLNAPGSTISDFDIKDGKIWFVCSAGYSSNVCSLDLKTEKEDVYLNFDNIFLTRGSRPSGILFIEENKSIMVLDSFKYVITTYDTKGKSLNIHKVKFDKSTNIKIGINTEYVPKGLVIDKSNNIWVVESKVEKKVVIKR